MEFQKVADAFLAWFGLSFSLTLGMAVAVVVISVILRRVRGNSTRSFLRFLRLTLIVFGLAMLLNMLFLVWYIYPYFLTTLTTLPE